MAGPVAAAVLPGSPLLLADVAPHLPDPIAEEVAVLRAAAAEAVAGLDGAAAVVVLTPGVLAVHPTPRTGLGGLGVSGVDVHLDGDGALAEALTHRLGAGLLEDAPLDVTASVLVRLVATLARPTVVVQVPPDREAAAAVGRAVAGDGAADGAGSDGVAVVACGDLACTLRADSPGYLVPGAADWDRAAVEAVREGRWEALGGLGPEQARAVGALGWAPLVALGHVAPWRVRWHRYAAPRGVGELVALLGP